MRTGKKKALNMSKTKKISKLESFEIAKIETGQNLYGGGPGGGGDTIWPDYPNS